MIRKLTSIITAFASFIGLVLIGNNAMANPVENSTVTQESYTKVVKVVNLNVSSPFLELNNKTAISILEHSGCSCGVCTQRTQNLAAKI